MGNRSEENWYVSEGGSCSHGWVKIYRKIAETSIWKDSEPFDKRSAWIDLILMANYKPEEVVARNEIISVGRGQIFTSIRFLSEKWHWSKSKIVRYTELLKKLGMIQKDETRFGTLITIENYEKFQIRSETDEDADEDADEDRREDAYIFKKKIRNKEIKNNRAAEPLRDPEGYILE